jgi:dCMP deaminase
MTRPSWDAYFMGIASAVSMRSNCSRRQFGAVIADKNHGLVSTGYNGTPAGTMNCNEGGCPRCTNLPAIQAQRDKQSGYGYDLCLCEHAERNAIFHSPTADLDGCTIYVTGRPCMECLRAIVTKRIARVVYARDGFTYETEEVEEAYHRMAREGNVALTPT